MLPNVLSYFFLEVLVPEVDAVEPDLSEDFDPEREEMPEPAPPRLLPAEE